MVVLDASVVLKWFYEEEASEIAREYQHRHLRGETVHAPDLVLYEMANSLSCKPGVRPEYIDEALDLLQRTAIMIHWPSYAGIKESAVIASRLGITVYDAAYLALSRELGVPLVTADKKLASVGSSGDFEVIVLSGQ